MADQADALEMKRAWAEVSAVQGEGATQTGQYNASAPELTGLPPVRADLSPVPTPEEPSARYVEEAADAAEYACDYCGASTRTDVRLELHCGDSCPYCGEGVIQQVDDE